MPNEVTKRELIEMGGDPEQINADRPGTQYYLLDKKNEIVTGECEHYYTVDEVMLDMKHIVCDKCGLGRYTNRRIENGQLLDPDE